MCNIKTTDELLQDAELWLHRAVALRQRLANTQATIAGYLALTPVETAELDSYYRALLGQRKEIQAQLNDIYAGMRRVTALLAA